MYSLGFEMWEDEDRFLIRRRVKLFFGYMFGFVMFLYYSRVGVLKCYYKIWILVGVLV